MRLPWNKSKVEQLDLVDEASAEPVVRLMATLPTRSSILRRALPSPHSRSTRSLPKASLFSSLSIPSRRIRTTRGPSSRTKRSPSWPETSRCAASSSRSWRARLPRPVATESSSAPSACVPQGKAGLQAVPVVIGSQAHDAYAQVAENQKRHGLTPLDLARFMRSRADAGESNAEIARRLGIDLTSVAHHLALLTLPPELDEAFRSGRCTSPRTLYELAKLQKTRPEQVKAIVGREGEITRSAVASIKKAPRSPRAAQRKAAASRRRTSLAAQANGLCARLESLLGRMTRPGAPVTSDELAACVVAGTARRHVGGRSDRIDSALAETQAVADDVGTLHDLAAAPASTSPSTCVACARR